MIAGRMKTRIILRRPIFEQGAFREEVASGWEESRPIWAERVKMEGRRSLEGQEDFPDYSVRFNIRDAHEVDENWELRHIGGHRYSITNIIPNHDRGMLTLVCTRINE